MLLKKRRTPFVWEANITKILRKIELDGASYAYARVLLASRIDLDRKTPVFLPYDLREWVPAGHTSYAHVRPKWRQPFA
jgi:hypothetical protein